MTDEMVANAPILILGNKIDLPSAAGEEELRGHFGVHGLTTGKVRRRERQAGEGDRTTF